MTTDYQKGYSDACLDIISAIDKITGGFELGLAIEAAEKLMEDN